MKYLHTIPHMLLTALLAVVLLCPCVHGHANDLSVFMTGAADCMPHGHTSAEAKSPSHTERTHSRAWDLGTGPSYPLGFDAKAAHFHFHDEFIESDKHVPTVVQAYAETDLYVATAAHYLPANALSTANQTPGTGQRQQAFVALFSSLPPPCGLC